MSKKRFIKIELMYGDKPQGSYIERMESLSVSDLLDGMDPDSNDFYRLSVVEMTEDEYNSLPEFMGW